ncbi:hypothetical protein [Fundicoccus culcitae]|uniref:DUF4386 domain-containing protein n=1 Tax=Fundicoccus culcitae TaxID=2969821 RepID=A0ABY5P8W0_9LACT|nr:hypothetical protein [Fundicoccus culcitae]UUX34798.1 hypothetical protein NRE15_03875 [Fundicoccus culcitae]
MNRTMGMLGSAITLISVILFAVFMLIDYSSAAYAVCIVLACGYIIMASSFGAFAAIGFEAAKLAGIAFAIIYGVFVMLVYYAQITTLQQNDLTEQAIQILDYQKFGLFFAYDLFGYAMLSVSTFFIGLTIVPKNKVDKILRTLLLFHGVFTVVGIIPVLGLFNSDMVGGEIIGVLVLEIWCLYFIPICILSYQHFKQQEIRSV